VWRIYRRRRTGREQHSVERISKKEPTPRALLLELELELTTTITLWAQEEYQFNNTTRQITITSTRNNLQVAK